MGTGNRAATAPLQVGLQGVAAWRNGLSGGVAAAGSLLPAQILPPTVLSASTGRGHREEDLSYCHCYPWLSIASCPVNPPQPQLEQGGSI